MRLPFVFSIGCFAGSLGKRMAVALVVACILAGTVSCTTPATRFVIISDLHPDPGAYDQLEAMTDHVIKLRPALAVVLGLPAAFVLHRLAVPGRQAVRAALLVPFVLPTVVVGVAFAIGLLLQYLATDVRWIESRITILPVRWIGLGLMIAAGTGMGKSAITSTAATSATVRPMALRTVTITASRG